MKFKPLGDRALVRLVEREETTPSGIVLPDTAMNYSIASIPTIARFEDGQVTQQAVGALPKNQLSARLGL